nr:uncharacterized protein LOC117227693 isoform X1 [Megalopta genalis]XP_033339057.1 uncharacterized protein LOC117227693 isoform X1 [Megalopta genalis]XP_033339058.1 uncharacterized protein LOC117227693 isoform X1 [Megalopta genalis]XP_033339059.1 uncharacterized protein LOC117227693 isoform X1 [Megalopta genalis]
MALSRISNSPDILTCLSRVSHAANASFGEMQCTRYAAVHQNRIKALHMTSVRRYPDPPTLPLPTNVSEIFASETSRFTPERSRDIAAPVLIYGKGVNRTSFCTEQSSKSLERTSIPVTCGDSHVDSYDCFGAVNLCSTMQTNVPKPFCSSGKSTHLNMPGGQWARDGKYIAEDMQKSHYRNVRLPKSNLDTSSTASQAIIARIILKNLYQPNYIFSMRYSTQTPEKSKDQQKTTDVSKKERFRQVARDYGYTVFVFHIGISLISLGACYSAVLSGVDLSPLVKTICQENDALEKILNNSSSFLLAYSVHKLFAPVRLSLTVGLTPILVRKLRKIGLLKPYKVKSTGPS